MLNLGNLIDRLRSKLSVRWVFLKDGDSALVVRAKSGLIEPFYAPAVADPNMLNAAIISATYVAAAVTVIADATGEVNLRQVISNMAEDLDSDELRDLFIDFIDEPEQDYVI